MIANPPGFLVRAFTLVATILPILAGCGGTGGSGSSEYVDNATADTTLAKYLATSHIATAPGVLTLLPKGTAGAVQTRGYAEYVPPDYAAGNEWPCIINLHGDGELGDGLTETALQPFRYSCLPGMIQQDAWDRYHRFVVLSPQFASYADRSAENVKSFVQYAKANYRIDVKRIYMTAVSGGGVALGNYLAAYSGGEAAAVLPISCYLPPTGSSGKWSAVPAWFLCGAADSTVHPSNVELNYKALLAAKPSEAPRMTLYAGVGHDANSVNKTYSPASNDNTCLKTFDGITLAPYSNVYDWLLQYRRQ